LQGWDASFSFATDIPRFSTVLQSEAHGVYNATSPLHMGLYPALARMVYRHDVEEGPVMATRKVHVPSMAEGKLGFAEWVEQGYDDKRFSGTIPPEMLAIGRFPIEFTHEFSTTEPVDMSDYWHRDSQTITAATGDLQWNYGKKYVAINTRGTKGIVGFAKNESVNLDDWQIRLENPFAIVLITDVSDKGNLQQADSILVTTVARAQNSGMEYTHTDDATVLKSVGKAPLLLEPVKATITVSHEKDFEVIVLDHDGRPTPSKVPVRERQFELDGGKYKTMYYLVVRKKN